MRKGLMLSVMDLLYLHYYTLLVGVLQVSISEFNQIGWDGFRFIGGKRLENDPPPLNLNF